MALETVVFQQDPFTYKDLYNNFHDYGFLFDNQSPINTNWDYSSANSSIAQSSCYNNNSNSSPEVCNNAGLLFPMEQYGTPRVETNSSLFSCDNSLTTLNSSSVTGRRKRRRTKCSKNKEEIENQRMTHIAVERNRRRQMNDYLAVLRSLMPPSYAQRGDQASIVGGAINFVKELEQLLQFLEARNKQIKSQLLLQPNDHPFSKFFTFPQYSTGHNHHPTAATDYDGAGTEERRSAVADIEVTMVESHANVKVLSRKRPKQLLKIVNWFQAMCLTILHLTVTTADDLMVLYSFSVKVEDKCQLNTVSEIASAVHEMVAMIKEDPISSSSSS